ncbi:MAG: TPM domain-containing protein, partial [Peptococcaceae bacterium]|nr:TPM domain-containing protein [Peptococcaceae bacterium]
MKNNRKPVLWVAFILILFLSAPMAAFAVVEAPAEIYVGDYANVLSEETERYIIEQNQALAGATGAQIVIVTVDFLDGMDIEDYAYTIFNDWGIGDAEKNNGLLLLLA